MSEIITVDIGPSRKSVDHHLHRIVTFAKDTLQKIKKSTPLKKYTKIIHQNYITNYLTENYKRIKIHSI